MNKNGGYTWIQTCATVVCNVKNADEQNIICVNYIISGRENGNLVLDQCQLGIIKREATVYVKPDNEPKSPDTGNSGDSSRTATDGKSTSSNNEIKLTNASSSLETSSKVVDRSLQNCDDETTTVAASKRGRKRKVKSEAKDESSTTTNHSPPMPINHGSVNKHHSDISVKDLENVMSKHLPKNSMLENGNSTDFSADTLLRQHNETSSHLNHQASSPMPATALLRQLYANRESVIRATVRPGNYMYPDSSQQQSLPTPPNDSYDSQYMRKSGENFGNLVSSYGGYSSMEYNNAMTPPSSVSPRDLTNHKSSGAYEYTNLSGDNRLQYQGMDSNSLPHLPLKPQPYSMVHQMDPSYSIDHQSQYFPYHSSFHLYHKGVYTPP